MKSLLYTAVAMCVGLAMCVGWLIGALDSTPSGSIWPAQVNGLSAAYAETKKPLVVNWQTLSELDYRTGKMTPLVQQLASSGVTVRIPGFMLPLEDSADSVTEFLLIPYFMACIHVPPPPPNQMVHVKMSGAKRHKVVWYEPIWVEGQLTVTGMDSPYGAAAYSMAARLIERY
jgi:hypothetical protein